MSITQPELPNEPFSAKRDRKRGNKRQIPRPIRRAAKNMGSLGTSLKDLIHHCRKNGIDITSLTTAVLDHAAALLRATGLKSADQRILAWRRAVDALPEDCKREFLVTEKMARPRGKRILSEAAGTFKLLEADLEAAIDDASRPPADLLDPHQSVKRETADDNGKRIMIIAATLYRAGEVDTNVRLADILAVDMQERFLTAFYSRFDPPDPDGDADDAVGRGDGAGAVAEEPAHPTAKGAWLASDVGALRFFAIRLLGPDSDAAVFAAAQGGRGKERTCLTGPQVLQLAQLTTTERLRELRGTCGELMSLAESETHFTGSKRIRARLRSANLAVAIAAELDLLLKPKELVTLACPSGGAELVVTMTSGATRLEPVEDLSGLSRQMLRRRDAVLLELKLESPLLFPSHDLATPQDLKSVCSSVGKILAKLGFPGVTMQVLRDVGAVALLRDDPKKARRVMVLLGLKSVRTVHRRYAPFLGGL